MSRQAQWNWERSADEEGGRGEEGVMVAKATAMVEARLRQQQYRTAGDWPVTVGLRIRS